ncbi:hypothetical protein HPB52_022965 [Rhipicephalus sanguineus]|uniref:Uncharacterized protein n=1 Tax=Rhipicephalus sanguineus TaxID=34632 RepID=A0A9D4PKU1_RHISA|nr:hypothetical protein HPB52_022965 [Rhipicephalus sanguineus]
MGTFSRHGGLLLDEIKLSEHLNGEAAGDIEGFADLRDYTTSEHKNVLADHGLVVLFEPYTVKLIKDEVTVFFSKNILHEENLPILKDPAVSLTVAAWLL